MLLGDRCVALGDVDGVLTPLDVVFDAPRTVPHPPAAGDRGPGEGCERCSVVPVPVLAAAEAPAPASGAPCDASWSSSGGCGGPCGPGAAPRRRTGASWLPCTAVWEPSALVHPRDRVPLSAASGRLWGRQGAPRGASPPCTPFVAPRGGSLSAVGGVQHLPGALRWVHNRLGDPSRSSGRSRIALRGPDPPRPRGFCPPRAPAGRRSLRQESPQHRCRPPRGPFVALGDALGAPAAALDALFGVQLVPCPRRRRRGGRWSQPCTPRKRAFFLQRPPNVVHVARGSAP